MKPQSGAAQTRSVRRTGVNWLCAGTFDCRFVGYARRVLVLADFDSVYIAFPSCPPTSNESHVGPRSAFSFTDQVLVGKLAELSRSLSGSKLSKATAYGVALLDKEKVFADHGCFDRLYQCFACF